MATVHPDHRGRRGCPDHPGGRPAKRERRLHPEEALRPGVKLI
jgi:hypothetical protein